MKREDVKGIVPNITEEQLQQIMDLHSSDIGSHKQSIDTLKAERDAARTQLGQANARLEGYDPDWRAKAADAQRQADAKIAALESGYAGLDGYLVQDGVLYHLHLSFRQEEAGRAEDLLHQWAEQLA